MTEGVDPSRTPISQMAQIYGTSTGRLRAKRCVMSITAASYDKTVIFRACGDSPHGKASAHVSTGHLQCWRSQPGGIATFNRGNIAGVGFRAVPGSSSKAVFCMHKDRPVTQSPFSVAPGNRRGLRVFLMLLLGAGMMCATALAAPAPGAKGPDAPAKGATHAEFVGSDTCATCHEEVSKGFATNPHTKMALMHGSSGVTCENCHGAGSATWPAAAT